MKTILDTHAFLWYATGDLKLSQKARKLIDSDAIKYLSIASVWEMAIKANIGKLNFKKPFEEFLNEQIKLNNYIILPLETSHLFKLISLPLHHRDPFDRILICQSLIEKTPILSVDNQFEKYDNLEIIW